MTASSAFSGRHVLVTGAGSGIGAAIAGAFAARGARVSLAGRRRAPLEQTAAALPAGAGLVLDSFDVTDAAAIAAGLSQARKEFGPVEILVNNAGEAPSAPFEKTDLAMWSHTLAVDLTGVFLVTQAVLSDLRARGPGARIINVASTAGLKGYAYVTAYCAAKHGVIGLTRALALELARSGVTVNAICPGFTDTPLVARSVATIVAKTGRSEEAARADLARNNPQGRLIDPQEIADAALWLASSSAHSVTGQALPIAGGEVMAG
jgi:NAD(P)-dependent dehydrogenase (short-subunit alcohol dehydrogenase family)